MSVYVCVCVCVLAGVSVCVCVCVCVCVRVYTSIRNACVRMHVSMYDPVGILTRVCVGALPSAWWRSSLLRGLSGMESGGWRGLGGSRGKGRGPRPDRGKEGGYRLLEYAHHVTVLS
jgi:hypothetical protein